MTKILFFIPGSLFAGTEKIMLAIMNLLKSKGIELTCITNGWNDGSFINRLTLSNIDNQSAKLGVLHIKKPLWTIDTLVNYIPALVKIKGIIAGLNPDYLYFSNHKWVFMLFPILNNRKVILHIHDYIIPTRLNKILLRKIEPKINTIIAVSQFIKLNLMELGIPEEKIAVIHNFIEIDTNRLLSEKPLTTNCFKFGIIGQIIPRKGHHTLLEAFALLIKKHSNCELHIAGDGDATYISKLKRQAQGLKISDKIIWLGFSQNTDEFYTKMNAIVVPTEGVEPFGLVAIEPMLFDTPVIVSDSGGLPEIITHGYNGLMFKRGCANNLYDEMLKIIENPELTKHLNKNAKMTLERHFSSSSFYDKFTCLCNL